MQPNNRQQVRRSTELLDDITTRLKKGDLHGFQKGLDELWDLYDKNEDLTEITENLSGALHNLGEYHSDRSDYIQLSGCVNDARKLSKQFPISIKITKDFTGLLIGMFALKFQFKEFDYLEDYIPEVLELSHRFENDEGLARAMVACMVNLLNLCPYGDIGLGAIIPLLDRLGELAAKFSNNGDICLANLRGLLLFCCVMKDHKRQDIYEIYLARLKNALAEKSIPLKRKEISSLRTEMLKQGLL